jgi:hypothetical protein
MQKQGGELSWKLKAKQVTNVVLTWMQKQGVNFLGSSKPNKLQMLSKGLHL